MTSCPFSPFKAWSYALKNLYLSLTAHSSTSQHDPWLWTWVGSVHCLFYQETLYSVTEPVSLFFVTLKLSWNQAAVVTSLMLKCFTMVAIYALRAWCWVRKQAGKLWMAVKLWSVLSLCLRALSKWSDCRFAAGLEGNVFVSAFYLVHIEIYIYVCNYVIQN